MVICYLNVGFTHFGSTLHCHLHKLASAINTCHEVDFKKTGSLMKSNYNVQCYIKVSVIVVRLHICLDVCSYTNSVMKCFKVEISKLRLRIISVIILKSTTCWFTLVFQRKIWTFEVKLHIPYLYILVFNYNSSESCVFKPLPPKTLLVIA